MKITNNEPKYWFYTVIPVKFSAFGHIFSDWKNVLCNLHSWDVIKWYSDWFNCIIGCNILACKYCFTILRSKEWSWSFLSQLLIWSRLTVAIEWAWSKWPKTSWLDEHLWPYAVILYHSVYSINSSKGHFQINDLVDIRSDELTPDQIRVQLTEKMRPNGSLLMKVFELRIWKKFYGETDCLKTKRIHTS